MLFQNKQASSEMGEVHIDLFSYSKEVYQQAGRMMDNYGVNNLPIVPYR